MVSTRAANITYFQGISFIFIGIRLIRITLNVNATIPTRISTEVLYQPYCRVRKALNNEEVPIPKPAKNAGATPVNTNFFCNARKALKSNDKRITPRSTSTMLIPLKMENDSCKNTTPRRAAMGIDILVTGMTIGTLPIL